MIGSFELIPGMFNNCKIETTITDPNGLVPSDKVFRLGDSWVVNFKWTVKGPVVPWLGGLFALEVNAESIGHAPEFTNPVATQVVNVNVGVLAGDQRSYDVSVTVPGTAITHEGVYRISKHLILNGAGGGKTAGFVEGEDIQFY